MGKDANNKLIAALVSLLVIVVVVQSFVMVKLYQSSEVPEAKSVSETFQMNLQPKAGTGQASAGSGTTGWNQPLPAWPYGGRGLDPGIWDPFNEFRTMRQQMDQIFNDSFGRFRQSPDFQSMWGGTTFSPSMDMEEKDDNYVIRMDIPGADKSNISVNIDDRQLVVSGKVDETIERQGRNQLRKERRSGEFKRALTLPGPVKADEMEAKYEKGVLTITVPKVEEGPQAYDIKVK